MKEEYFELMDDLDYPPGTKRIAYSAHSTFPQGIELPDRWYLGKPLSDADEIFYGAEFAKGIRRKVKGNLTIELDYPGVALDFTLADMPVVNERTAALFWRLKVNDVDFIPCKVQQHGERYYILNAYRTVDCIDRARSLVQYWADEPETPEDLVGAVWAVDNLCIKSDAVKGLDIFRPVDWNSALIVSNRVKEVFEEHKITGIKFRPIIG